MATSRKLTGMVVPAASWLTVLAIASCGGSSENTQTTDEAPRKATVTELETVTDTVEATSGQTAEDSSAALGKRSRSQAP